MTLVDVQIIAPDSSHWSRWIDDALSGDRARREAARGFHRRLLDCGRVAFLSWHHLEELLCIEDDASARNRVSFLQSLPLVAWMRLPDDSVGLGGITDILAAEAIGVDAGCDSPAAVRDYVRRLLMRTGPAVEAIGTENWVWDAIRPLLVGRRSGTGMVAALAGLRVFDGAQTVGQVTAMPRRDREEQGRVLAAIREKALREALGADPRRSVAEARVMADEFVERVLAMMPPADLSVRDLIVRTYVSQGLDAWEVRDECRIEDLSALATFRSHLRTVADKTGLPFDRLKRVPMERLPSWLIVQALRRHGQQRVERPGSNVTDEHLAVLAAYTDVLYVDKRTHEDFRRVLQKAPDVAGLVGRVAKAARYEDLAAAKAFGR